jgi:molybdopterin-guanine dinucleotide biosynthesis protein A
MFEEVNAVILAGGGGIHEKNAPDVGPNKSLVKIGDRIMIDYVVAALRQAPEIKRIVVVGPPELQEYCTQTELQLASSGDAPLSSLTSGLQSLHDSGVTSPWVLVCTGDIPFLTPAALAEFIDGCRRREADFYYPIINRQTAEAAFPGVRRTYVHTKEGYYTGGNIFLINQEVVATSIPKAEGFVENRKDTVAMARLVGIKVLILYLLGILAIEVAERKVSSILDLRIVAVICRHPEIGVDVDKPSDLALAEQYLVQQKR